MEQAKTDMLVAELRGWHEVEGMSDDARRKLWLMQKAADEIERLRVKNAQLSYDLSQAI